MTNTNLEASRSALVMVPAPVTNNYNKNRDASLFLLHNMSVYNSQVIHVELVEVFATTIALRNLDKDRTTTGDSCLYSAIRTEHDLFF